MSSGSCKNVVKKIYHIYEQMYKQDVASNNLHGLICYKTQPANLFIVRPMLSIILSLMLTVNYKMNASFKIL